jgi:hypothetical protein
VDVLHDSGHGLDEQSGRHPSSPARFVVSGEAQSGGPIAPRTGLFVSGSLANMTKHERDEPGVIEARVSSAFAHLVRNASPQTQLRLLVSLQHVTRPYGALRALREAGIVERDLFLHSQAAWDRQLARGARLEIAAAFQRGRLIRPAHWRQAP